MQEPPQPRPWCTRHQRHGAACLPMGARTRPGADLRQALRDVRAASNLRASRACWLALHSFSGCALCPLPCRRRYEQDGKDAKDCAACRDLDCIECTCPRAGLPQDGLRLPAPPLHVPSLCQGARGAPAVARGRAHLVAPLAPCAPCRHAGRRSRWRRQRRHAARRRVRARGARRHTERRVPGGGRAARARAARPESRGARGEAAARRGSWSHRSGAAGEAKGQGCQGQGRREGAEGRVPVARLFYFMCVRHRAAVATLPPPYPHPHTRARPAPHTANCNSSTRHPYASPRRLFALVRLLFQSASLSLSASLSAGRPLTSAVVGAASRRVRLVTGAATPQRRARASGGPLAAGPPPRRPATGAAAATRPRRATRARRGPGSRRACRRAPRCR